MLIDLKNLFFAVKEKVRDLMNDRSCLVPLIGRSSADRDHLDF